MLTRDSSIPKGLPKKTDSLCPECLKIIPATLREEDGKVVMEKKCPDHGSFKDTVWSDAEMYLRAERWAKDGVGVQNPLVTDATTCPFDCGLCNLHLSHTGLANVDLTNRCNLRCPICFANANAAGYVFEPDFDTVVKMLKVLRAQRPVPTPAVQFSGGEPTIYPRFLDVIKAARELGFAQIQVATNGIKFAESLEFCQRASDAGMNTVYLQFDGLRPEIYKRARGKDLLDVKKKVVENFRKVEHHSSIVFVPTVVKGVNDDQVWPILHYALENMDVVRGVNFQPVAFTGRISNEELAKGRYTLSDLARDLETQSGGKIRTTDWYPVPAVAAISELWVALYGDPKITLTTHAHCGIATYMFVKDPDNVIPITRFVDVDPLFTELYELAKRAEGRRIKAMSKVKAFNLLRKHLRKDQLPDGMSATEFLRSLKGVLSEETKSELAKFSWRMMYVGAMHFMDSYNYDIERVKRCMIHYTTPDGRIIPFCAYNSGPVFRASVEKQFSVPLAEWRKRHGEEYT